MPSNKKKKFFLSIFGLTFFTLSCSSVNALLAAEISCLKKLRNLGLDFLYLGRVESDFYKLHRITDYQYINKNEPIKSVCLDSYDCKNKGYYFTTHQGYPYIKFYGAKLALKDKTINCELSNKSIGSKNSSKRRNSIKCGDFLFFRVEGAYPGKDLSLPTKTYFSNITQKSKSYRVSDIPENFDKTTQDTFDLQALYYGDQWYKLIAVRDKKILFDHSSGFRWDRNLQPKMPAFPALSQNELATNKIGSTIFGKTNPNSIFSSFSYKSSCCQNLGSLNSFSVNFLAIPEKYSIYFDEFSQSGRQFSRRICSDENITNETGIDRNESYESYELFKEKKKECYKAAKVKINDQLSNIINRDDLIPMNLTINLQIPVQKTNLNF